MLHAVVALSMVVAVALAAQALLPSVLQRSAALTPAASVQPLSSAPTPQMEQDHPPVPQRNLLEGIPLEAKAAVAINARTGEVLGERNALEPRPLASLTKIFTALAVVRAPFPQRMVEVSFPPSLLGIAYAPSNLSSREASFAAASSSAEQPPHTPPQEPLLHATLPVEKALAALMSASSNEVAEALARGGWYGVGASPEEARHRFLRAMNTIAQALGLKSVQLQSPSGLDFPGRFPSAVGSPLDIAYAVRFILSQEPSIAQATLHREVRIPLHEGSTLTLSNTNPLAWKDARVLFSKTGFTNAAGGNLALAVSFDPSHSAIIVVMGSSHKGRIRDVQKISEVLLAAMRSGKW